MTDLTVILPAFRQAPFIESAVQSLLNQTDIKAQLILSDDASEDDTFSRMQKVVQGYHGPHEILLNRNPRNLGRDHVAHLVGLARHDIIVMAHGDDIAEPHRCQKILETFQNTTAKVVTSNASIIDVNGEQLQEYMTTNKSHWISASEIIKDGMQNTMLGAVIAWHRTVYTAFPPLLSADYPFAHDLHIAFRGALLGGTRFLGDPLLKRRIHARQWTHRLFNNRTADIRNEYSQGGKVTALVTLRRDFNHWRSQIAPSLELSNETDWIIVLDKLFEEALLANLTSWIDTRIALEAQGLIADWTLKSLQPGAQWSYPDQLVQQIQNMRWQLGIWRRRWLGR